MTPIDDASLTSSLLRSCNALISSGDHWPIAIAGSTWLVDDWRPGREVTPALAVTIEIAGTPFRVHLDRDLADAWFGGASWSTMSADVRSGYFAFRARPLFAWLEATLKQSIRPGVIEPGDGLTTVTRPAASGQPLRFRLRRQSSQAGRESTAPVLAGQVSIQVADGAALAILDPLFAALRQAGQFRHGSGRQSPARRSDADAIDFELVVARVRLAAAELSALAPGDLLLPPALRRRSAATAGTGAIPLSICLGRTPIREAGLEHNGIRFGEPVTAGVALAAAEGSPRSPAAAAPPTAPLTAPPTDGSPRATRSVAPLSGEAHPMTSDPQHLQLDVTLRFGQMRMTLAQLAATRVGQLIETGPTGEEPEVDILVDGRVLGRGRLVRIGQDWGVSVLSWQVGGDGK